MSRTSVPVPAMYFQLPQFEAASWSMSWCSNQAAPQRQSWWQVVDEVARHVLPAPVAHEAGGGQLAHVGIHEGVAGTAGGPVRKHRFCLAGSAWVAGRAGRASGRNLARPVPAGGNSRATAAPAAAAWRLCCARRGWHRTHQWPPKSGGPRLPLASQGENLVLKASPSISLRVSS